MNNHIPVLLDESIDALNIKSNGIYIDGTFGRGGHSKAILNKLDTDGRLLVIDKDPEAIKTAEELAKADSRVFVKYGSFKEILNFTDELNISGKVDGILVDLGVSSPQLDSPERGFSFLREGPLDMRMDPQKGISAKDWINSASLDDIKYVLKFYGEEKFAGKIAKAVVERRQEQELITTLDLANLIERVIKKKEKHKHPATRTFQAIRIFINNELDDLKDFLQNAIKVLKVGGRLAVITFHSLEDRIVKNFIKEKTEVDKYPKYLPIKHSLLKKAEIIKIGKFTVPKDEELKANVRARSAKLRVIEKQS